MISSNPNTQSGLNVNANVHSSSARDSVDVCLGQGSFGASSPKRPPSQNASTLPLATSRSHKMRDTRKTLGCSS